MTNRNNRHRIIDPQIETLVIDQWKKPQDNLNLLIQLQERFGSLTRDILEDAACLMNIPAARLYGIASFYSMLDLEKHIQNENSQNIRVCDGPVCWLCGGGFDSVGSILKREYPDSKIIRSSCLGLCDRAPAVLINKEQSGPIVATKELAGYPEIIGKPKDYSIPRAGEIRVLLKDIGVIDPDKIESALENGAYQGLRVALNLDPLEVVSEVEKAKLFGRGGAGFPTGKKWRYVADQTAAQKYVICNADESEPLCFKDRVLIDTNPHQILEGMAIAAYAVGANHGYIYIRGEYHSQKQRLEKAIEEATKNGWLGYKISKKNFSFHVEVHQGAGAYICGEETGLIESLEGKRGEPRKRPPYPPSCGYQNQPTLINNVETIASIPHIINKGAEWFNNISENQAGGTKLYMLLGQVNNPGLFEAKFGLTLRQIINDFGNGMQPGSKFNFALCGGAAGTIVGESMLDMPIDYGSSKNGITLGAGAFLICDKRVSPVSMLRELMKFFLYESCGKCTPCREGTQRVYNILDRLVERNGRSGDAEELMHLAGLMEATSFCGLGQSVNLPVASALKNFKKEFAKGIRR